MADNSFRAQRRDTFGRAAADTQRDRINDDPFAELARLIGQSDPQSTAQSTQQSIQDRRAVQPAEALDEAAPPALDWSALGEDQSQQAQEVQQHYGVSQPATYQPYPAVADVGRHEPGDQEPISRSYSPPAALFEDAIAAARQEGEGYGGELAAAVPQVSTLPYIPRAYDGDVRDDDGQYQAEISSPAKAAAAGGYLADVAAGRRRAALVIVGVLGVVVAGTAGALGYHAMFGGSVIPSLPPIIKPGDTPVKIVPKKTASAGDPVADAKAGGDQLVPHQEKPVNVQSADSMPRVVTTIPVLSNPAGESPLPGATPPMDAQQAFNAPGAANALNAPTEPGAFPAPPAAPPATSAPNRPVILGRLSAPGSASPSESKPVRTVAIKPVARSASRPPPSRTRRELQSRTASAAPLSIMPTQAGGAQPRTRTAMAHDSAPASSGPVSLRSRPESAAQVMGRGYAVQVSSQHSEAAARAEFRALQAKFPQQLGHREGLIRRANLGAKGVYYRVFVGPFASAESANSLCGSLKAAGASCLVQKK